MLIRSSTAAAANSPENLVRTIVNLDLKNFTRVARNLEEQISAAVVSMLREQIQTFIDAGLQCVGADRAQVVITTTGDGAVLAFADAASAHQFAVGVHRATEQHNSTRNREEAQRWFRIGMATGTVYAPHNTLDFAGTVRIDAVRMEGEAEVGQIVVDKATFARLAIDVQRLYGPEESVTVKHKERLAVHRCTVVKPHLEPEFRETYVNAPALPANYVERPEVLQSLRNMILSADSRSIALTALQGMGGIGKSVLAQALCHDPVVQQAFPDGIIWVTAGKESAFDLVTKMREVGKALKDDLSRYDTELGGRNQYRATMRDKAALIVIDDVWQTRDIEPFLAESRRSRLLITTRIGEVASGIGACQYAVSLLTEDQSHELLATGSGLAVNELPSEAEGLINECGRLPLAISMVGAMLSGKPQSYWRRVLEHLRDADLRKIRAQFPNYAHADLLRAIQISVEALETVARERYLALAVVLEGMAVHPAIQQTLWNVDQSEAEESAEQFISLSLAQRDGESIRLHDLQLDYVRAQYPDREALCLIHDAVRLSSHVIVKDPWQFASQVIGRLLPYKDQAGIHQFTTVMMKGAPRPWLRPLHPALDPPRTGLIRTLQAHGDFVWGVALSADGRRAVSAPSDNTLHLWDLETGEEREVGQLEGYCASVAITADGRRAVSASSEKTLQVWNLETGREVRTLHSHSDFVDPGLFGIRVVTGVAVSADGRRAVSASKDFSLTVWDLETADEPRILHGHSDAVFGIAVSADGRRAVSASEDRTLKVWDLETGYELRTFEGAYSSVSVSADGRRAIAGLSNGALRVWDLATGSELRTLEGDSDCTWCVGVSGDGRRAVSASWSHNILRVWDVETGRELRRFEGASGSIIGVAISVDGRRAASAFINGTLKLWDLETRLELRKHHSGYVCSVAMSPDGRYGVSASKDMSLKVWDLQTGCEVRTLLAQRGDINDVAVSPDGRHAIAGLSDGTLKVWDLKSGREVRTLKGHSGWVVSVGVSADGRRAVSASHDGTLKVWDLKTGRALRTLEDRPHFVSDVALTADGRRAVSAYYDGTLKVWGLESGLELRTLDGHSGLVSGVAVSPDGRRAVSGSRDKTLKVWDLENGRELRTLGGHTSWVNGVAVSPDGWRAVSASEDKTLKVWHLETGELEATFTCDSAALCCAFVGDGMIAAGDQGGHLHFLRFEE